MLQFQCFTISMCYSFCVSLFPCVTVSVLHCVRVLQFQCFTTSVYYSFSASLFPSVTFQCLASSVCYSFSAALFPSVTVSVLHSPLTLARVWSFGPLEAPLVTIDDTAASADAAVGGVAGGGGVVAEVDLDHAVFTPMVKAEASSIERNHPRPSCCGHTQ